jgi:hypothetical protein
VTHAMAGYVPTADMLRRLLHQHAADECGYLRSTIVGALVACGCVPPSLPPGAGVGVSRCRAAEQQSVSTPHTPREDGLAHLSGASRTHLADALSAGSRVCTFHSRETLLLLVVHPATQCRQHAGTRLRGSPSAASGGSRTRSLVLRQ